MFYKALFFLEKLHMFRRSKCDYYVNISKEKNPKYKSRGKRCL